MSDDLLKYIKEDKSSKTKVWLASIGLQEVDGLKPSNYLIQTVKDHIDGYIDFDEVNTRINNYYEEKSERNMAEDSEEADKVSVKIAELLSEDSFHFSPVELTNIHKRLFENVLDDAGQYRKYNFKKEEWVLKNKSVIYASYETIRDSLNYDFEQEKNYSYKNNSLDQLIIHLCFFISDIWQIHPFSEGNTRTVAVFLIKYLRAFGFNVNYDVFKDNSWYFRNALVRANYRNYEDNIFEDISYLEKFLYNLLTPSNYELKNRYMHVDNILQINEEKYYDLSLEEKEIIKAIKSNSFIKQEELASIIHKSLRTVKSIMLNLQERGIIKRINGKKNGEWNVIDIYF